MSWMPDLKKVYELTAGANWQFIQPVTSSLSEMATMPFWQGNQWQCYEVKCDLTLKGVNWAKECQKGQIYLSLLQDKWEMSLQSIFVYCVFQLSQKIDQNTAPNFRRLKFCDTISMDLKNITSVFIGKWLIYTEAIQLWDNGLWKQL